jgi:hypothetical protein
VINPGLSFIGYVGPWTGNAIPEHDLLSTAKISNIGNARKDAKTTNSGSLGAKTGGRRRTSITRCF